MKKLLIAFCLLMLLVLTGCNDSVYTVNFIVEGEVVSTQQVKHGDDAVAPANPELEGATFKEWDKSYKNVKENLDINAVFEKEEFSVVFFDEDGNVLKQEIVKYNESATAPQAPEKEGHVFKEWSEDITCVKDNLEVTPVYEKQKFTVTFKDEDGTVLKEAVTEYGKTAAKPTNPSKHGYKFTGWDKDYKNVTSDLVVTATYELETYTITYKDEKGNIIEGLTPSSYTINDATSIELPIPEEKEGYECLGWFSNGASLVTFLSSDAENKVFTLKYKELPKPLELPTDGTFLFKAVKKIKHSTLDYFVYQPDFTGVTVPSTSATAWTWTSLQPDILTISAFSTMTVVSPGYAIVKATYSSDTSIIGYLVVKATSDGIFISSIEEANTKVEYEVTFTDEDGNVIETQKVEEGKAAILPTPPTKDGYTFYGWSADHFNVKENITLEPTYIEGKSDFAGKTVSILGDSGSTYKGYVPDGYACFYPTSTSDFGDVNQTWWMQTINKLGMKLLKNNSWGGTCVSTTTGTSATTNDNRLKEILLGSEAPDILIIFMGANDAGSNINMATFESSYKLMMDKIKVLCPNTEIYIMTLASNGLYNDTTKEKYNEVIRSCAKEYQATIIELSTLYDQSQYKNYAIDSGHPNLAGMTLFANRVIESMLKAKNVTVSKQ